MIVDEPVWNTTEYICHNPNCGPLSSCCPTSKYKWVPFTKLGNRKKEMTYSRNPITVCVSLYGNPIHRGHCDYIRAAAKLGDFLIVIVNNDEQVKLKGAAPFMDVAERAYILENIKGVTKVTVSIDKDRSVCKTLEYLHYMHGVHIFANGGDVSECLEKEVCDRLGIRMMYNIGGEKVQSSSGLLRNRANWELAKFRNIVNDADMSNVPLDSTVLSDQIIKELT